jgi:hypothetical protein
LIELIKKKFESWSSSWLNWIHQINILLN